MQAGRAGVLLAVVVLGLWYAGGVAIHGLCVNTDPTKTDQGAYLNCARQMRVSGYTWTVERNRMPIYIGLLSLVYREGMSVDDFFAAGKRLNAVLSGAVILAVYLILRSYLPVVESAAVVLVYAFTVLAFRAAYCQAEILFYGVSFAFFVLALQVLVRPRGYTAVGCGAMAGVAHLTKASILPALVLLVICLAGRALAVFWRTGRSRAACGDEGGALSGQDAVSPRRTLARALWPVVVVPLAFLIVVGPYIVTSRRVFGSWFYNVNSSLFIWCESWDDVKQQPYYGTCAGSLDGYAPEQLPSLGGYLDSHSGVQIVGRFLRGFIMIGQVLARSTGYVQFGAIYLGVAMIILLQNRRAVWTYVVDRQRGAAASFVLMYLAAYSCLYAFYAPIAVGERFILAIYLPLLFVLALVIRRASDRGWRLRIGTAEATAGAVPILVLGALAVYLVVLFPFAIANVYSGY